MVVVACVVFFVRRNGLALARFRSPEMGGWPTLDANLILIAEVLLMFAFLSHKAKGILSSMEQTAVGFVNGLTPRN